jgi:hypothetical protein
MQTPDPKRPSKDFLEHSTVAISTLSLRPTRFQPFSLRNPSRFSFETNVVGFIFSNAAPRHQRRISSSSTRIIAFVQGRGPTLAS